jgi:transposase
MIARSLERVSPKLLESLRENRDLRNTERLLLAFVLRFVVGYYSLEDVQRHLKGKLPPTDLAVLYRNCFSSAHRKKLRSLSVILHLYGMSALMIAEVLGIYPRTVKRYFLKYGRSGLSGVFPARRKCRVAEDPEYEQALFTLLHSPPKEHGFNRTTWRVPDLMAAMARIGKPLGKNQIGKIFRKAGYRFLKAREVLTSNDPDYREKLKYIQSILSNLEATERFFSIDEFGPVAVKKQGGRRLVGPGEYPTIPQFQKSKGSLIVTAALELSTNQVTHFYSSGKNTDEMIKLLKILLRKYRSCSRLYLSWDAASWHESKRFLQQVEEINSRCYREKHRTPIVELAPLPARAQFLNVIESVFNGLAVSVVHNSDYGSVEEAKAAIDRYFEDRNWHFQLNPRKAGDKIWGKERVPCKFDEAQNCKNPRFR